MSKINQEIRLFNIIRIIAYVDKIMKLRLNKNNATPTAITCSKLNIKTLEQRSEICSKLSFKETKTMS